jgi:hypothetical protein
LSLPSIDSIDAAWDETKVMNLDSKEEGGVVMILTLNPYLRGFKNLIFPLPILIFARGLNLGELDVDGETVFLEVLLNLRLAGRMFVSRGPSFIAFSSLMNTRYSGLNGKIMVHQG